jgi:hypothetical protein
MSYLFDVVGDDVISSSSDSSPVDELVTLRSCAWCGCQRKPTRLQSVFCCRKCRQSAFRTRREWTEKPPAESPRKFAYLDPPYGEVLLWRSAHLRR